MRMISGLGMVRAIAAIGLGSFVLTSPAFAELALSQLVVELSESSMANDVEVFNDSAERIFIVADPREILDPGMPSERPET